MREDYSPGGDAWDYLPHDHARSRAYRWGEDGIAGISDDQQRLCLSLALWNGQDPILKERLFGLTNSEGNHGEDVKELYYYLDATPTHSYLKMLYKYPQREFPYARLVRGERAAQGDGSQPEFELLDTGIFDDDRYFDVFVEYAKAAPEDILMRVTVHNRGPEAATTSAAAATLVSATPGRGNPTRRSPSSPPRRVASKSSTPNWATTGSTATANRHCCSATTKPMSRRLFGQPDAAGFFKDAFHEYVIAGNKSAVNPAQTGTKAGALYELNVPRRAARSTVRLRLSTGGRSRHPAKPFADFDAIFARRRREADEFYAALQHDITDADARTGPAPGLRGDDLEQAILPLRRAGMAERRPDPAAAAAGTQARSQSRTGQHLNNADIISMPDKWEYPWYAAWDLAFHCLPLAVIDAEFAKSQLVLLTREWYMHPNGQLPAYEWAFGDVNPPVHAWATWRVFQIDRKQRRESNPDDPGDLAFLERVFHKLLLNFTWWVNRKDEQGRNIFQGGFLGLDNIGCFDRSTPLPTGGFINQADGTSWMAMYCLNLLRIAPNWPCTTTSMRTSPRNSSSTSSPSPAPSTAWATTRSVCGTKPTSSTTTISACRTGKICR